MHSAVLILSAAVVNIPMRVELKAASSTYGEVTQQYHWSDLDRGNVEYCCPCNVVKREILLCFTLHCLHVEGAIAIAAFSVAVFVILSNVKLCIFKVQLRFSNCLSRVFGELHSFRPILAQTLSHARQLYETSLSESVEFIYFSLSLH